MPPAAITGTSTCEHTSGSSTIDANVVLALEPAAFATFGDDAVDAGVDGLQRGVEVGHDVEHGDPGLVQRVGVAVRVAGRRGCEPHALVVHELDDAGIADERLRDVHPERLVGEVPHLLDLFAYLRRVGPTTSR